MKPYVYWIEGSWPGKLAILARPRGSDWLGDEISGWKDEGLDVVVSLLTPSEAAELGLVEEETIVKQNGLKFISFPITDYNVPSSKLQTRKLVHELNEQLNRGQAVGIHCRQGIGRSSLVAACLLTSSGESPEIAFQHIENARGRTVPDTPEQKEWVASFANNS